MVKVEDEFGLEDGVQEVESNKEEEGIVIQKLGFVKVSSENFRKEQMNCPSLKQL